MDSGLPISCSRKHPLDADTLLIEEAGDDPFAGQRLGGHVANGDLDGLGLLEVVGARRDCGEAMERASSCSLATLNALL